MGAGSRAIPETHDASILAELSDVFGPERLDALLEDLDDEIVRRFQPPSRDRAQLAKDAHATMSISGALGFEALSQACAALEAACGGGGDLKRECEEAVAAAGEARAAITGLRAHRP